MDDLLTTTDRFVLELFKKELDQRFVYHNYTHTARVVKSTKEIIANSEISVKEEKALLVAAWLHDTGYTKSMENHEEQSAKIAQAFLTAQQKEPAFIDLVKSLIIATKFRDKPTTFLEEIIRDADSSHFAKDYYNETSNLLKKELLLRGVASHTSASWRAENIIVFTEKHQYFTPYAIKNWSKAKNENLLDLMKDKRKEKKRRKKEELKVALKNQSPERAIQTLFRTTLRNHLKLSDIADTKANILLSVNAIIVSLALANLIPKLGNVTNKHLLWPTLILVLFSVASIILSIMATKPNVTNGEFTDEQVEKREVNLLFFGNFHKMPFEKYKTSLMSTIQDKEEIYEALIKDLWFLGMVLNRKYMLLRWTYTIFMMGIVISVASFVVSFYLLDID
jgi:HD superfamily phosphodiesterase